jgi:hypothetical protein
MNGTASTPTANATIRQRITSIIAVVAFILAMLLGGGAPHGFTSEPSPTPPVTVTPR